MNTRFNKDCHKNFSTNIDKDCLLSSVTAEALESVLTELYGEEFKREGETWRSRRNRSIRFAERGVWLWHNFETGEGGDYLDAVRLLKNIHKAEFPEILEAAAIRLGYSEPTTPEDIKTQKETAAKKKAEREAAEEEQRKLEAAFLEAVNEAFVSNRAALENGLQSPEGICALKSRGMTPQMLTGQWCGYNASNTPIKTRPVRRWFEEKEEEHTIIKPHSFAFHGVTKGVKSIAIDPKTGHKRQLESGNGKTRADIICTTGYSYRLNDGDGGPLYLCEGEFDALTIANATGATVWATHANTRDMSEILKAANAGKYTAIYLAFDNDEAGENFTKTARLNLANTDVEVLDVRQAFEGFKDINDKFQALRKEGQTVEQTKTSLNKAFEAKVQTRQLSPREKAAAYLGTLEQFLWSHTFGKYSARVDPQGAHDHTALYCALALASIQCATTRFIRDGSSLTRVVFAHLVGAPKSGKSYAIEQAIIAPLRDTAEAIDSMDIPEGDTMAPNAVVLHEVDDNSPEALRNSVQNTYCIREEFRKGGEAGTGEGTPKTRIIQRQNKPVLVRISKEFSLSQSDKKSAELRRYEAITNELADGKCKASRALWRNSDKEKFPTCEGVKYLELDASQFATFKQFIRTARDNASGYVRRSYMLKCGWKVEGNTQIERIQNESTARRTCMERDKCIGAASMFLRPFNPPPEAVTLNTEDIDTLCTLTHLANELAEYRGRAEMWLNPHADGVWDTDEADNVGDYAVTLLEWFSCLAAATESRNTVTQNDLFVAACIARRVADCEMWVDGAEDVSDYTGRLITEFKEWLSGCVKNRRPNEFEAKLIERSGAEQLWVTWAPRNVALESVNDGKQKRKAYRLLTPVEKEKRDKMINSPDYHSPNDLAGVRRVCEIQ